MGNKQLIAIDKNESYSEKVYRQLKRLIMTNQLRPGEPLNERELAEALDVSRTPIRDALRMLEQEGWIAKKGKQKVISLVTRKTVLELLELRMPLELMSYDLAMEKITDDDVNVLQEITNQMQLPSRTVAQEEYYDLMAKDIAFHVQIARITKNNRLIQIISDMGDQLVWTAALSLQYGDLPLEAYPARHNRLMELLREKEYGMCREALKAHIETWENNLKRIPDILCMSDEDNLIF